MPLTVLVTGATGRTGSLVVKKLQARSDLFDVRGFARSPEKAQERLGSTNGLYFGDIREPSTLSSAMKGCQALVILTSAAPQMKETPTPGQRPEFEYPQDEMPEIIDYQGQVNQIDVAKSLGVNHVVLVGSMGGTLLEHPLNKMGSGNILVWKRKAEDYLIASGLNYTLIHPGGLLDQPGSQRELLLGQNDRFLTDRTNEVPTSIPRADVAEIVVQALLEPAAQNLNFDVISKSEDDETATVTTDFKTLFESVI